MSSRILPMGCIALASSSSYGCIMNSRTLIPQMMKKMATPTIQQRGLAFVGSVQSNYWTAFAPSSLWKMSTPEKTSGRRSSIASIQTSQYATSPINLAEESNKETTTTSTWNGQFLSQTEFMERDTVLVTDMNDNIIDSASKKSSHEFSPSQPYGILHRAFSVFLFDSSTNELLLQQRASTKITFPNVWTNTCCSHPLHGMDPPEVDGPNDVTNGIVTGVKNGAVRKLEHELGIPMGELDLEGFKFLTRVQYWAADTVTHGVESPWGEHEIDYILFITIPNKDELTLKPHPDEVDDIRWVSQSQLLEMFDDTSLLFSPWFRIIAKKWMIGGGNDSSSNNNVDTAAGNDDVKEDVSGGGGGWWDDLDRTMNTNDFCDYETIHRFDPPNEHMGGAGNAKPLFSGPM